MKKLLLIGLMVFCFAGTAWSFSANYDHLTEQFDHVTNPEGAIGDLLFYPVYLADGSGWETKISVINTSNDLSTVAKVVIRGGKNSQELLDFFIYLSPDDMWTAKIYNDNGVVRIYSEDDSVLSNVNTWANESPMNQALQTFDCENEVYGYVTIFDSWTISRARLQNTAAVLSAVPVPDLSTGPIDKDWIYAAYQGELLTWESENILTGFYEVLLPTIGLSAMENAVVMQDYEIIDKLTLGRETFLGESSRNSIAEVEAKLSKENVYMPYYNDGKNLSAHIFTFVSKETVLWNDPLYDADCEVRSDSPFFDQYAVRHRSDSRYEWCIEYGLKVFDLEENTPNDPNPIFSPVPEEDKREFCEEVNIFVVSMDPLGLNWYDEGFALYQFQLFPNQLTVGPRRNLDAVGYTGAPVIPLSANLGADGLSLKYGAFQPASIYNFATVDMTQGN